MESSVQANPHCAVCAAPLGTLRLLARCSLLTMRWWCCSLVMEHHGRLYVCEGAGAAVRRRGIRSAARCGCGFPAAGTRKARALGSPEPGSARRGYAFVRVVRTAALIHSAATADASSMLRVSTGLGGHLRGAAWQPGRAGDLPRRTTGFFRTALSSGKSCPRHRKRPVGSLPLRRHPHTDRRASMVTRKPKAALPIVRRLRLPMATPEMLEAWVTCTTCSSSIRRRRAQRYGKGTLESLVQNTVQAATRRIATAAWRSPWNSWGCRK